MEFRETGTNSVRAESEVVCGNQFRKSGQIDMAINKYKCAICLFIYSIEDTQKETQKAYYQLRINQVLELLNEAEKESHQKLTSLNDLKQFALIPTNKSQILSQHDSLNIRCTINYPQLNDSYPSLSQYGSFRESQFPDDQDIPEIGPTFIGSYDITRTSYPIPPQIESFTGYFGQSIPSQSNNNSLSHIQIPIYIDPTQTPTSPNYSKPIRPLSDLIINLNDFKIITDLGYGSFGIVSLAEEISTGDKFAIKKLNNMESSGDQRSFLREVEVLAQAVYPAVLHIRGFCLNPIPSIVTEYLPGGSLQDVINGTKKMNKTQRIKALYGVASAMRYLHEKLNIVHRDLKPANVMLNQNLEPVVGDFGLAKMMTKMMMRQTQKAGSPVYMAPELMSGKEYTNKVDVYSFGIICYELLSESLAFAKITNLPDLFLKVIKGERPDLNNTKISISFRDLISKCWREDADQRPSFRDIVNELKNDQYLVNIDKDSFKEYCERLKNAEEFDV